MKSSYDTYYQTENLFGEPYPELMAFFAGLPKRGKLLDLGCGQGRDALALGRLGYEVLGIDNSRLGIEQLNQVAQAEQLEVVGQVGDIYAFDNFEAFDVVLLDSMFHFAKADKDKEVGLIQQIVSKIKTGALLVVCIQDTGKKVQILEQALDAAGQLPRLADQGFTYVFEDKESGHTSKMAYRMIAVEK